MTGAQPGGPPRTCTNVFRQRSVRPAEREVHRMTGRSAGAVHAAYERGVSGQVAAERWMPSLILSQHLLVGQRQLGQRLQLIGQVLPGPEIPEELRARRHVGELRPEPLLPDPSQLALRQELCSGDRLPQPEGSFTRARTRRRDSGVSHADG